MGRRLGQHFLHDPAILDRIVRALDPAAADVVVEIGAGQGTLTRRLAPLVRWVIAIEKDPVLAAGLRDAGGNEQLPQNVRVVEGDALSLDWHSLIEQFTGRADSAAVPCFKVIGNVPYYITTPLIEQLFRPPLPRVAVYLIQREVADRLVASPGTKAYGALTIGVRAVAEVERLFTVRPGSFSPPPAVDSALVRLTPLAEPLVTELERASFRRFLVAMFGLRRKQLSRSLRTVTGGDKIGIDATLQTLGIDRAARPEVLTPGEMLSIFRALCR